MIYTYGDTTRKPDITITKGFQRGEVELWTELSPIGGGPVRIPFCGQKTFEEVLQTIINKYQANWFFGLDLNTVINITDGARDVILDFIKEHEKD